MQTTIETYHGSRSHERLFHGQGRAKFRSGPVYEGSWQHGKMHGQGLLQFPDGVQYEGDMVNNSITGYGVSPSIVFDPDGIHNSQAGRAVKLTADATMNRR